MRFPDVDMESDSQFSNSDYRHCLNLDSSTIRLLFVARDTEVTGIEVGFFAHESREQILARKGQRRTGANVFVVLFAVSGVLAWAAFVVVSTPGMNRAEKDHM
jgi:hypothetical protein